MDPAMTEQDELGLALKKKIEEGRTHILRTPNMKLPVAIKTRICCSNYKVEYAEKERQSGSA